MSELLQDPEVRRAFEEELLVGEATENVAALLRSLGISQRELARRLGVSESRVSQILAGSENLTLRSLAGLGWALGMRFDVTPVAMGRKEREGTPASHDPMPPDWLSRLGRSPRVEFRRDVPSPRRRDAKPQLQLVRFDDVARIAA